MNYHINTILIWDSFKKKDECPVCLIEDSIEKQIVSQYLNEAVMEDDYRADVNKYGFCPKHYLKLYGGENKLGVALQTDTRLLKISEKIEVTDNVKTAIKFAEKLKKEMSDCIICRVMEFNMSRYLQTIPKMYNDEREFAELFGDGKGFCMKHYPLLLKNAKFAAASAKKFLQSITVMQKNNLERLEKELKYFTEKFDYRNHGKPWGTSQDALPRSINKMHGNIIESAKK